MTSLPSPIRRAFTAGILVAAACFNAISAGEPRRHGIGIGYAGGTLDVSGDDDVGFNGISVFGKWGINRRWSVLVTYRELDLNDHVPTAEDATFDVFSVHALRMWRSQKAIRPHLKFGVARSDFETRFVTGGTFSDDTTRPAIGAGFEWGSPRFAFFFDGEWIKREIEFSPGADDDVIQGTTSVGFLYKF